MGGSQLVPQGGESVLGVSNVLQADYGLQHHEVLKVDVTVTIFHNCGRGRHGSTNEPVLRGIPVVDDVARLDVV
jgi:hypothetical protein